MYGVADLFLPKKINSKPNTSYLEATREEELSRLLLLTENLPGSVYQYQINPDGSSFFPFATHGISEIYGYSIEEIKANAEKAFERIHPDDLDKVTKSIQESASSMQDWHADYRVYLPSKELRWLHGQAKPQRLENGAILWSGYLSDITKEKKQAEDLQHYQSQYRIAMEATQIGIWSWNIITNEVIWSDEAYTLLGYEPQQFPTTFESIQDTIIHPEDLKNFKLSIFTNLEKNERLQVHFRLKSATGKWLWIESRGRTTQLDSKGKPIYMMGTHTDITNIKRTEDALMEARQIAERAVQTKSDLLSTVSHEIRTPLSGIIGLSELNLKESDPQRLQQALHKIYNSSERLLQILNDTLDYSKIEAGQLQPHNNSFNIEETIHDLIELFKPNAISKNLALEVQLGNIPKFIVSDELRLRQILSNLISNAIKFTQQGKIIISVHIQQFSDTQLEFSISDTGIGIEPEVQAQLFSAYSQADTNTAHYYGGTGLGLMISARLVKLLGGEGIKLVSELGQGACFSFVLPFKKVGICEAHIPTIETKNTCSKVMQGYLLVADDVETNREIAQHILKSLGFAVAVAENGQQALNMAINEDFDLVFMDLSMPILDGFTATQRIKQHKPKLPIIALTASAIELIQSKLTAAGLDDYVSKPFKKQELCKKLTKWLPTATLKSSNCTHSQINTPESFNFNSGLALFTGNENTYIYLLHEFSAELNGRYRLLGEKIEQLMAHPSHLKAIDWLALHSETHALKGTSANLGLNGLANVITELDNLLRQALEPSICLLTRYQEELNLAIKAIKDFTKEYAATAIPVANNNDKKAAILPSNNSESLDELLRAIKANEFIDEIKLAQEAQKIPARLIHEWSAIANAVEQLNFALAEKQLITLIAKIK